MKTLLSLITKYAIILVISYLFSQTWFYFNLHILPIDTADDISIWHNLPTYSTYIVRIVVAILLFIDIKKYKLNYYLIPVIGLFYPLFGICAFLILLIYNEIEKGKSIA